MDSPRPTVIRILEVASVTGFAIAAALLLVRVSSVEGGASDLLRILLGAALGYVLADVVSGIVHWFCDTFFHEDTPVIGRAVIHPFREHHADPLAITRHGFFEVNGNNCLALLPLLVATLVLGSPASGAVPALFWQALVLGFALATFATNQFHKWAHQKRPSRIVRWLQGTGLVLSPAHHQLHHSNPYRQAFCITAGWLDPLLDRAKVFERIELAVRSRQAMRASRSHKQTPA